MKKLIFFLQYEELGSSSKYRILIYKQKFDQKFKTKYCYFWNNQYVQKYMKNKKKYFFQITFSYVRNFFVRLLQLLFIVPRYDVVVFQRCVIPYMKSGILLRYIKLFGVKIIFDIDDALHIDSKYDCQTIARLADHVSVGSNVLKDYYLTLTEKVRFIPTVDNNQLYEEYKMDTFSKKCIGWIGSHSTIENLELVADAINRLIERHPEVYLKIISDNPADFMQKIKNCKFVAWNKDTYMKEMSEFTIGIMPLKENDFNKGKCGFKLIQYLDLEKPVAASDCGENKTIVHNYGDVCNNEEDWYLSLEKLLFDKKYYEQCIFYIKNDFIEHYGFENNYQKLENIILKD